MAGFASLFTDFDMFKIYLKKLFLLANSIALFTYTETWLDVAQTPSVKYLSTSTEKKKKKANYEKSPNPKFSFDGGFVTKERTNFNW